MSFPCSIQCTCGELCLSICLPHFERCGNGLEQNPRRVIWGSFFWFIVQKNLFMGQEKKQRFHPHCRADSKGVESQTDSQLSSSWRAPPLRQENAAQICKFTCLHPRKSSVPSYYEVSDTNAWTVSNLRPWRFASKKVTIIIEKM